MGLMVVEDYWHDEPAYYPQNPAVRCEVCGGVNGLHLVEGLFYHRDPALCAVRRAVDWNTPGAAG
jgi:hypothetical protein